MQKCYENSVITKFFKEIQTRGRQKGAVIEEIGEIGRKLDIGIDVLRDIKSDTSVMSSFVAEQRMHNQNLERILEKLAER